jgi:hypothetical protein
MQEPPRLHFGLGAETHVDAAEIRWPDGSVQTLTNLEVNGINRIRRREGGPAFSGDILDIGASPNPFQSILTLRMAPKGGWIMRTGSSAMLFYNPDFTGTMPTTRQPEVSSTAWWLRQPTANRDSSAAPTLSSGRAIF